MIRNLNALLKFRILFNTFRTFIRAVKSEFLGYNRELIQQARMTNIRTDYIKLVWNFLVFSNIPTFDT